MTSVKDSSEMIKIGVKLGTSLRGGEVIELIGDVGAGKTTLVKGIGKGLGIDDDVQSPSFTISRVYSGRDRLSLHHYDFYRLSDAGVMSYELAESIGQSGVVTIVEWAGTVADVLPEDRVVIQIADTPDGKGRELTSQVPQSLTHLESY